MFVNSWDPEKGRSGSGGFSTLFLRMMSMFKAYISLLMMIFIFILSPPAPCCAGGPRAAVCRVSSVIYFRKLPLMEKVGSGGKADTVIAIGGYVAAYYHAGHGAGRESHQV